MVDETNREINRRKVLQTTGLTLTGITAMGAASAETDGPRPVPTSNYEAHHVDKSDQNTPRFANNDTIGFAKGGFNRQITQNTINQLYATVLKGQLDRDTIALPKPAKNETGPEEASDKEGTILGAVVSIDDGQPYISVERTPPGFTPPNATRRKAIEGELHRLVDEKVDYLKQNGPKGINGGVR